MRNPLLALALCAAPMLAASGVTFTRDVAPIVYKRCVNCHHADDIAPMPLVTYADARPWAKAMRQAVLTRQMPPWHADPHMGNFANDRRLRESEIDTIKAWVDQGAVEGDAKDLPAAPQFPDGWKIGKPDVVIAIPEEYVVQANGPDEYVNFTVPTNFTEDRWVTALELRPGNRKIVHHAHVSVFEPPKPKAPGEPEKKDNFTIHEGKLDHINPAMPVLDDGCSSADGGNWPGRHPSENGTMLASYLPGKDPDIFPEGYARLIPAGAQLTFQIHYNSRSITKRETDRTSVGIVFAKAPPKQRLRRIDISNYLFQIPAGDGNHEVTACYVLPKDVEFMSYTAHMHFRGKDMKFEAVHPDGARETLFFVPHYSFNWQTEYQLSRPVAVEKGTKIVITAHFDNSPNNAYNPDPSKAVRWGGPSYEEMMDGWFEYILPPGKTI